MAPGGAIGHRQGGGRGAEELHECADHIGPAQGLSDLQHQIGRGGSGGKRAVQMYPDHVRHEDADRLAEHRRLGLDAAHAPSDHAEAVDHGGMRVGADQRVREVDAIALPDRPGQMLEIDLMHDAVAGRDHGQGREGLFPPLDEAVALGVARELQAHVPFERIRRSGVIDLHRMVDHQIHRHLRFDQAGWTTEALGGIAHRGQVAEQRDAGEVLQQDARHHHRDLGRADLLRTPARESVHMLDGDLAPVAGAHGRLEQDA